MVSSSIVRINDPVRGPCREVLAMSLKHFPRNIIAFEFQMLLSFLFCDGEVKHAPNVILPETIFFLLGDAENCTGVKSKLLCIEHIKVELHIASQCVEKILNCCRFSAAPRTRFRRCCSTWAYADMCLCFSIFGHPQICRRFFRTQLVDGLS